MVQDGIKIYYAVCLRCDTKGDITPVSDHKSSGRLQSSKKNSGKWSYKIVEQLWSPWPSMDLGVITLVLVNHDKTFKNWTTIRMQGPSWWLTGTSWGDLKSNAKVCELGRKLELKPAHKRGIGNCSQMNQVDCLMKQPHFQGLQGRPRAVILNLGIANP